jgi:electron transfer flavoprotein alpha subunit
MSKILIIGEHDGKTLNPATAKCVTCAAAIPQGEIAIALLGADTAAVADQAAGLAGVKTVWRVDRAENAHPLAATFAPQVVALAEGYSHVFGPSTSFGKDLMPRVAALLGVAQVSDLMAVEGAYKFRRPIYAGNAIVTVATSCVIRGGGRRRQRCDRVEVPQCRAAHAHALCRI